MENAWPVAPFDLRLASARALFRALHGLDLRQEVGHKTKRPAVAERSRRDVPL